MACNAFCNLSSITGVAAVGVTALTGTCLFLAITFDNASDCEFKDAISPSIAAIRCFVSSTAVCE